jgi:hypothetical protein
VTVKNNSQKLWIKVCTSLWQKIFTVAKESPPLDRPKIRRSGTQTVLIAAAPAATKQNIPLQQAVAPYAACMA